MNVYVFLGPTLSVDEARSRLPAVYLPPAAQGDVYRAANERPFAIGIVDGYFERVPAVWHKEILWAMAQGGHVFGASSMGALRAAELAPFGMVGVGKVFEAFASGQLEDDDEVAVAHADASTGYRLTSDAMVNVRATLDAAERAGAVKAPLRVELESLAKGLFYPERSFGRVLALATERGVPMREVDAVRAFVASHRVDQKREDALALLDTLAASCTTLFDAYRAPMSPQERGRRVALGLNQSQIQNLDRWGNPYALSEVRFHMTLTGKVPASRRKAILGTLLNGFRAMRVEASIAIDRLALLKQDTPDSAFRVVSQSGLKTG